MYVYVCIYTTKFTSNFPEETYQVRKTIVTLKNVIAFMAFIEHLLCGVPCRHYCTVLFSPQQHCEPGIPIER